MNTEPTAADERPLLDNPAVLVQSPADKAIRHLAWPKLTVPKTARLFCIQRGKGHNIGHPAWLCRSQKMADVLFPRRNCSATTQSMENLTGC